MVGFCQKQNKNALLYSNEELAMLNEKLDSLLIELENANSHNKLELTNNLVKRIDSIKEAILVAEDLITDIRDTETKKMIFRSRTKWAEEGEKSNKYFLNLIKVNQAKTIISNIKVGQSTFHQQKDIKEKIKGFYQSLYNKKNQLSTFTTSFKIYPK